MTLFYEDLSHDDLTDWAGSEHVHRADPAVIADWRIPSEHKRLLAEVGVPEVENLIGRVCFQAEPHPTLSTRDGSLLYCLTTETISASEGTTLMWAFAAEPGTGAVHYVLPDGEVWFANTSVALWLQSLHHYGLRVDTSDLLLNANFHDEDAVIAELRELTAELEEIDPAAFRGYHGFIWVEFLNRWLW
ncbi:SUKH-4 family immunity protein [Streptomyces sp. NPDC048508]|uniref:SUKH-4 family immunity protein n=1 Tax=Streptomyces sp. NPDC048508 TaxID=3365561 RepID=UPI00371D2359